MKFPKKGWIRVSKDVELSIYPTNLICSALMEYSEKVHGFSPESLAFFYFNNSVEYFFHNHSYAKYGERMLKKLLSDESFLPFIVKKHFEAERFAESFNNKIKKIDPKRCTNKALISLLKEYNHNFALMYTYSVSLSSPELDIPLLTNKIQEILRIKSKEELFPIVTTPIKSTVYKREREDFLNLKKNFSKKGVIDYLNKYYWIHYGFEGKVLNSQSLKINLQKENINPDKELKKIASIPKRVKEVDQALKFTKEEKKIINLARETIYLKAIRKYISQKSICDFRSVLNEIASRMNISMKDLLYFHPNEIDDFLKSEKVDNELLKKRKYFAVYIKYADEYKEFIVRQARKLRIVA